MVGGLYKQGKLLTPIYIVVVFLTFVAGIYHNPFYRMLLAQLFQKRDEGFDIRPVRGDIIPYNVFADCGHIHIISGL